MMVDLTVGVKDLFEEKKATMRTTPLNRRKKSLLSLCFLDFKGITKCRI